MNNNLKIKTINGIFFKTIERILLQGITLAISIVLARILMPEDYGNVALLLVFITILEVLITYGFGAALIQKKQPDEIDFSTCFYFSVGLSIVLYGIIFLLSPLVANYYGNDTLNTMIKVMGVKVVFSGVNSIQSAYIAKNFLFRKSMIISFVASFVSGGVGIFMAYNGFGEWALIVQTLLSSALVVIITFIFVRIPLKFVFSFERLKSLFKFGWKLMVVGILSTGYDELRSLIIGKKYSTADLAYYDKGRNFPKLISNNVNSIIDGVIFSTMSSTQDDLGQLKNILSKSIKIGLYILSPMLIGLAAVSHELIFILYTEKWAESAVYLEIFSFSFVLMPVITLNLNALKSIGKSGLLLVLDIIKKVIGMVLIIISSFFGVFYIACSVAATNFLSVCIHIAFAKREFKYSVRKQILDIASSIIPAAIMGATVYLAGYIPVGISILFVVKVCIGILVFLICSIITRNKSFLYLVKLMKQKLHKSKTKDTTKKKFVFFRSGMSGGSATLSYRIGKKMNEEGYDVYYLYKELNDINNYNQFESAGFIVKKQKETKTLFEREDEITVLTYSLQEHVDAISRFKKYKNSIVLFYPITNGVSGAEIKKLEKIRPFSKKITKTYFKSINDSHIVFYTHEKAVEKYKKYYQIAINNVVINPLPIDVLPFNEKKVKERYCSNEKIIISFLRTDFPLKGYVFPLIRSFSNALENQKNVKLFLIVQGDKYDMVKKEINKHIPPSKIELLNGCSYNELINYIDNSYLNVGHGTSVLDASAIGVPTIVSVENSFKDVCCGFFSESKVITGKMEYVEGDYITFINRALNMSYEEYYVLSKRAYDYMLNEHSMDSFINCLLAFVDSPCRKNDIKCEKLYYIKTRVDNILFRLARRK